MRVNMYPNPRFSPDGASTGAWGIDYANDMPGDGTLRPSHSQGFDELHVPELDPGAEYVFSVRSENGRGSVMLVIGERYSSRTVPDGNGMIVLRLTAPATGSQKKNRVVFHNQGVYSQPQLELASTYDAALGGGVSSLLLRRHHATRLTPRTGTVMPDDGNEPMHEPILDHHPVGRPVGGYHDHSEQARDEISGQRLCERHRRHYLDESVWRPQCKPTCQLRVDRHRCRSDVNVLFRQVRQSDRHRDQYAHLHVGRVSGEQDPARRHRIFHREYDAARLTLTGVVA
uniref:Uncharacterized protein n=1 Tax=Siphoviridae sp. ct2zh4 TaxID=2825319 RepID=A0A8S5NT97_9CAUD|nr:MAG TPA: hypothetical protein [Siphoviridae sp. ct2zh4]